MYKYVQTLINGGSVFIYQRGVKFYAYEIGKIPDMFFFSVTKDKHHFALERNYFEYTNLGLYNACCIVTTFKPWSLLLVHLNLDCAQQFKGGFCQLVC